VIVLPGSIGSQINIFLYSTVCGIVIAFIYDIFRIKRKAVKTRALVLHLEDFIYWIIVALVMFTFIYYSNDGEFRGFVFAGAILGVILYVILLSRIVIGISMAVLRLLFRVLKLVWNVAIYPFRVIFRFFGIPAAFMARYFKRLFKLFRRSGRIRLSRAIVVRRVIRNKMKKI
jgi:spore cortex biosynthesis protein YabQ